MAPITAYLICLASALATFDAGNYRAGDHYAGTARASANGHIVYKEEHFLFDDTDGLHSRLVLYRCPGGEPFARKWVRARVSDEAPDFDMFDARLGYREGVRSVDGGREAFWQENRHASLDAAKLPERPDIVIDAGFDAFVRNHWDDLHAAEKSRMAFVVPSRLGYVEMRIKSESFETLDGESVRRVRLSLDAWYAVIAPTIDLTYSRSDHRLRRFKGLSNILDLAGKRQDVRIDFPSSEVYGPPRREEIDRAADLPLVKQCSP